MVGGKGFAKGAGRSGALFLERMAGPLFVEPRGLP